MYNNICDSDEIAFVQYVAWLADIVNQPHISPAFAIVMRGEEKGTGKSIISATMQCILETMAYSSSDPEHIFGRFTSHLQNTLLVVGEEMSWGGDRNIASKMKDLITSQFITVEKKGIDIITAKKYFRIILIDNDDWVVNASKDERRWLVLEVNPQKAKNDAYFSLLVKNRLIIPDAAKQVFDVLSAIEHSIAMTKAVETKGLANQKLFSISSIEKWWIDVLMEINDDYNFSGFYESLKRGRVNKADVFNNYLNWYDNIRPLSKDKETNSCLFGRKFIKIVGGGELNIIDSNSRGYLIKLDLAKERMNSLYNLEL